MSLIATDESTDYTPSAVKVYVRVRPFINREISLGETDSIVVPYDESLQNIKILDPHKGFKPRDVYSFDDCWFSLPGHKSYPFVSQDDIFDRTGVVACENVFEGYNSCIFAYGQTGSGKTYTMMGNIMDPSERGIIPRVCGSLLNGCAKSKGSLSLQCTYYEIYNERVMDLLDNSTRDELRVRNDPMLGPYVEGLSAHPICHEKDVMHLLHIGSKVRHTAMTKMNKQSSRSHAVLTLQLVKRDYRHKVYSKINLVDLAGSERTSVSEVEGKQFKEATKINLSLTTLGRVIDALADQSSGNPTVMPPYRESLLTWLLSDSLGGNSKTCMIATVSPAAVNFDETINTLRYASRAREIINICVTNDDPYEKRIKELTMLVEHLRKQLTVQSTRSSLGRISIESNVEPIDEKSAKHYQEVVSRLHQQINKLAEENAILDKKLQDEREAHECTIRAGQTESAVLQREIKTIRALSQTEVDALKKGVKTLDLSPVTAGRRSFEQLTENSSGRFSTRAQNSVPRYELPIRQPRERPALDSIEHMDRLVERYTRDMAKIHKEYTLKGQEIIEMQSIRIAKIVQSRPPQRTILPKTHRSSAISKKILSLANQQNVNIQPSDSKELQEARLKIENLTEEYVRFRKIMQNEHQEAIENIHKALDNCMQASAQAQLVGLDQHQSEIVAIQSAFEAEKSEIVRLHNDQVDDLKREYSEAVTLEHNENIAKVESLIESHNLAIESLQSTHALKEADMSTKHAEEMASIRKEMSAVNQDIEKISAENLKLQFEWKMQNENLEKEFTQQIQSIHTENTDRLSKMTQEYEATLGQYEDSKTELVDRLRSFESQIEIEKHKGNTFMNEIDGLRKNHASSIEQILTEHAAVLQTLKKTHSDEVEHLETKISKLNDSLRDIVRRGVEVERQKQSLSESHKVEIDAIKAESTIQLEKELDACKLQFDTEKKSLIRSHEEQLNALHEAFRAEQANTKTEHALAIQNLEKEHSVVLTSTQESSQAVIDSMQAAVECDRIRRTNAHENTIRALQEEADAKISEVRASAQNEKSQIEENFQKRIESVETASKNAVQYCFAKSETMITELTDRNAEIFHSFAKLHQETVAASKQSSSEIATLQAAVANQTNRTETLILVSLLCSQETSNRISLVNAEWTLFHALVREQMAKESTIQIYAVEQKASNTLRSEQRRFENITIETKDALTAAHTRHANDFALLRQMLRNFDILQRQSQRTIDEWQLQHHRIVSAQYVHMHAEQLATLQEVYASSIGQIETDNTLAYKVMATDYENRMQQLEIDFASLRNLDEAEYTGREKITREEAQSLQQIYSVRLLAFHARERGLQEIISVLEAVGEVATDSAQKQQAQIRKLESSIALYKVLQLEGELGMQSGII